jgi:DNA modification methylase
MDINLIKPYAKNAKKHELKQIKQVAESIKRFGFVQPLVVDKNNEIVIGHARFEAAKLLGLIDVPAISVEKLTDDEVKALRLADNKLNESAWDLNLAIEDLKGLDSELFDLTGFDKDLLIEPDEKDDLVPENAPPVCKLGDLWQLGKHRLLCGDSTSKEAVERLMGGVLADMVFTDPPYGVNYEGKTKDKLKIQNDITTEVFKNVLPNYVLSVKNGASLYVCCPAGNKFKDFFIPFEELCHLSSTIIWVKNSLVMGHGDYHYRHEPILYGWVKNGTHQFYGDRTNTTVWEIDRPTASKLHPTMKPIALIDKAIMNSSKSDDIVLDLFGGSGSTLIACEKTNRTCYMMELSETYCDVIIKRWEDYAGATALKI